MKSVLITCLIAFSLTVYSCGETEEKPETNVTTQDKQSETAADYTELGVRSENVTERIKNFDQAISLDSTQADVFAKRGYSKLMANDLKGALEDYNKAIELNPEVFHYYQNRGSIKSALNDFIGAIDDHKKAMELTPEKAWIHNYNIASNLIKLNRKDDALEYLNKSIKDNDVYWEAYLKRAIIYYEKNLAIPATENLNKVIEIDPKNARAYYYWGLISYSRGEKREGCEALAKSVVLGYKQAETKLNELCENVD